MPSPHDLTQALNQYLQTAPYAAGLTGISVRRAGQAEISAWSQPGEHRQDRLLAYSITKTLIAILLLQCQQAGQLELDMPLSSWRDDIPQAARISLRQLLNHSAGLPDYGGLAHYHAAVAAQPQTPWQSHDFLSHSLANGLAYQPGHGWAYSNIGYLLLKEVLEQSTQASLATLVATRIAAPLGLSHTSVCEQVADLAGLVPANSLAVTQRAAAQDVRSRYHPGWVAHGVVASTPSELSGILAALFDGRLLDADALAQMTTLITLDYQSPPWQRPSYGLGLMADPATPWGPLLGHNGGGPGYRAGAWHAPELQTTVCVMSSQETLVPEQAIFAVMAML